jgi:hypothetical protein
LFQPATSRRRLHTNGQKKIRSDEIECGAVTSQIIEAARVKHVRYRSHSTRETCGLTLPHVTILLLLYNLTLCKNNRDTIIILVRQTVR